MKKRLIFISIFVVIIAIVIIRVSRKGEAPYDFVEVKRGDIVQVVSATGQLQKGGKINLSFKTGGRIEEIYAKIGDNIEEGEDLAKIDDSSLIIQLDEAKAVFGVAQANLDKLLAGASEEEIKAARTAVKNANTAYEWAVQALSDNESSAKDLLNDAYEDSQNILDSSYLYAYNASNEMGALCRGSFWFNYLAKDNKDEIAGHVLQMEVYYNKVKNTPSHENIDEALLGFEDYLIKIRDSLEQARETIQSSDYFYRIALADKSSVDTQRSNINIALTNTIGASQDIVSVKALNDSSLTTARAGVSSTQGALTLAEDNLALKTAPARQEDVDLYQAQLNQAQAKVNLLKNQIQDTVLKSPVAGQVVEINKEVGEAVQVTSEVVSLLPEAQFHVELDIPETDIGKIKVGHDCTIVLDAFPDEEFSGKVIEIDPAETIIGGVIYYQVKISVEAPEEDIKPGMTADVTIVTDFRQNALVLPQRAVIKKDGKKIVRIVSGKNQVSFEEVEVETGIRGSEGEIEILSGVQEGQNVITFISRK